MSPEDLTKLLGEKMRAQHITPRVLLDRLRLIDDQSRHSSQYQDPNYLPLYYHLAKFVHPKNILNVGLDLGLPLCCFLQGSTSVEAATCFQRLEDRFYSPRLAVANVRDIKGRRFPVEFYHGSMLDQKMQQIMSSGFDLILVTENCDADHMKEILEICWGHLNLDGYMVLDRTESNKSFGEIFSDVCKSHNRASHAVKTRYGTLLVQK